VLKGSDAGTFAVPRQWTDQDSSYAQLGPCDKAPILDYQCLLALKEIIVTLTEPKKEVDK
jgi:hypothetical protein